MTNFVIIKATPGPKTDDRILELLKNHPQGLTVKELSEQLNRPVSMIQTCLKLLVSSQKVTVKKKEMVKVYYLRSPTKEIVSII
ncbi:winged helix-turn-helix transcriptional regulator [Crocosphaera sp. XPORK-15E]|uniref:winged helix-turn-helix transcriptional regulator n=1 Tax=Crocosphaera sp. XPORK-15E TaxID=3110247 RepID=UPI002B203ABE|nr:winged helix-turn-helix transcriptional regulator [Crocosphaera sp. XPORK-15E]MEA5536811.1 winged helix-turn-helix transcriptional regulator [Crocosphaera sp. XPORK-15E]